MTGSGREAAGAKAGSEVASAQESATDPAEADAEAPTGRGRLAWHPHGIPVAGWIDILHRVRYRISRDFVPLMSAGVAFFGLLAFFPAIASLVSLVALFTDPTVVVAQFDGLAGIAPAQPLELVRDQAVALADQTGGQATLTAGVSLILSLFWASRGMDKVVDGVNLAHGETERRNLVMRNVVSLALTVMLTAFALLALILAVAVPVVTGWVGLDGWSDGILRVGRWPLLVVLTMTGLGVVYRYGPARKPPRWSWVTPGAVIATGVWLGGSLLFAFFVRNFGSYNPTYGTLAGVVILLLYMWLTSFIVLLGAQLNGEMEHQTRHDTTRGPRRPMGQRGAFMADTLGRGG